MYSTKSKTGDLKLKECLSHLPTTETLYLTPTTSKRSGLFWLMFQKFQSMVGRLEYRNDVMEGAEAEDSWPFHGD